ncbi:class I SAM-dependent methyltransferase [Paenibacillus lutrae]|uniref:Methyltransferase domain-containing protein n=1 Tax=Paenibacillus lutrae TaxID=2078573 RepID=A0A7X3FKA9_9BACL|nr:class I SAM-dependent methyltransferase [Paenibacillus lutrae]MVP01182.1 methyltransferase domain-containing protein [Paenibacillus lutrae]
MDKIRKYYNQFDEWGRLDREPVEFMINSHFIRQYLPAGGRILDNGAGPGKYAMKLAEAGYKVTLTDYTPRLVEIAESKAREHGLEPRFDGFHTVDARDLGIFSDEEFDGALMLGPMYHLQTEEDRIQAVSELHRVTAENGIVFVAFMSRTRHLTTSLLFPEAWKPNHTAEGLAHFMATGIFNHSDEGRFTGAYYFDIEAITPFMETHGFQTIKLIGSGSVAGVMNEQQWDYWRSQGEEAFRSLLAIVMKEAENPYNLGSSSHLLYIGKRV